MYRQASGLLQGLFKASITHHLDVKDRGEPSEEDVPILSDRDRSASKPLSLTRLPLLDRVCVYCQACGW